MRQAYTRAADYVRDDSVSHRRDDRQVVFGLTNSEPWPQAFRTRIGAAHSSHISLALDFSIGAEKFIKGCAKKMKLRDPDRSNKGAAVKTAPGIH